MKTSAVLSSLLFGSFAVAAPFDRRALAYKTEIVTETVVVYTTVWDDEPVAQATTTPAGYFYEQPKAPSSAVAEVTPTPQAPAAEKPTEKPAEKPTEKSAEKPTEKPTVAPETTPAPVPSPTPAPYSAPAPAPVVEQPKPVAEAAPTTTTEAAKPTYEAPAPAPQPTTTTSAAAPAYTAPASGTPSTGGATYQNVDMTIYDNNGGFGACGTELHDTDMIVALAAPTWGKSTYDVMTGAATNPWCGQKIKVEYNGNSIVATIMDLCPGCAGEDIDLSLAAWKELTGLDEKTRLKASWSKID